MPIKIPQLKMIVPKNSKLLIGILGLCLAIFGFLYAIFSESIFNIFFEKLLVLQPGSLIFKFWSESPVNATIDVYLYNWTNSQDVTNASIKPMVKEVGPYRFIEVSRKVDLKWHSENASITYEKLNHYYFDSDNSIGSLDDEITTLNILALGVATNSRTLSMMHQTLANMALKMYKHELVTTKKVRELLFDGYEDPLLSIASLIPSSWTNIQLPVDKFGYAYGRNGTSPFYGLLNIHTGADDIRNIGKIHTWNNHTKNPFYNCNVDINGSAGEFQSPNLKRDEFLEIFIPDICRPLIFEYESDEKLHDVPVYRYIMGLSGIDNGTLYPKNELYCNGDCLPVGVMNISKCIFNLPSFISYPHFYMADQFYRDGVDGQYPDKRKHETYMYVEPRSGLPLGLVGKLQINLHLQPMEHISLFRKVPDVYLPMMWFEYKMSMSDDLMRYPQMIPTIILCFYFFGIFCSIIGLILFMRYVFSIFANRNVVELNVWDGSLSKNIESNGKLPDDAPLIHAKTFTEQLLCENGTDLTSKSLVI